MIYIYIYIYIYIDRQTDRLTDSGRVELPRWGSLTLAPIIRIYTCIHMYTYVYTWSKLASTTPAMEMTREATERLQKRQERLRKRQEGPADPRFRQQRLRKLSLRQHSRSPLSESQQRRDDRLSRRRESERKRRLRKQQRNERYAWGGVGRETELGGLLRLWRPNQRKERLA